jgi:hypothetical protein
MDRSESHWFKWVQEAIDEGGIPPSTAGLPASGLNRIEGENRAKTQKVEGY